MKKVFPLNDPRKNSARVLDAVKHDVRKYVKRERGKTLPEGFNEWAFDCRVGASAVDAQVVDLPVISTAIDKVAQAGAPGVYIEILARAAIRAPRGSAIAAPEAPAAPAPGAPPAEPTA